MAVVNPLARELVFKIVYYGPGLCGKTTTLQHIHETAKPEHRGRMVSLATPVDRTLYFDFLPIRVPNVRNMGVRLQLFTVPGQVYFDATRRLVLTGADGVVFVADSQAARAEANLESLGNLEVNLRQQGRELENTPHVLLFNKRDLPQLASIEELEESLNWFGVPSFATVATTGMGVYESLEAITRAVLEDFERQAPDQMPASGGFAVPEGGLAEALKAAEAVEARAEAPSAASQGAGDVESPGDPVDGSDAGSVLVRFAEEVGGSRPTDELGGEGPVLTARPAAAERREEPQPPPGASLPVSLEPPRLPEGPPREPGTRPGVGSEPTGGRAAEARQRSSASVAVSGAEPESWDGQSYQGASEAAEWDEGDRPTPIFDEKVARQLAGAAQRSASGVQGSVAQSVPPSSHATGTTTERGIPAPRLDGAPPVVPTRVTTPSSASGSGSNAPQIPPMAAPGFDAREPNTSADSERLDSERVTAMPPSEPAEGMSLSELWPLIERPGVIAAERAMASGQLEEALERVDQMVHRTLAQAAGGLGAASEAPRDPAIMCLLLGVEGRRYLALRWLVRQRRRTQRPPSRQAVLEAYLLAAELQSALGRIPRG